MVQQRNIALAVILSLVTCGLYSLYWVVVLSDDVSKLSNEPNFSGVKAVLLGIVTCGIYYIFWYYQLAKNIEKAQASRGKTPKDNAVLYVVLGIFGLGIVTMAIAQNDVNELA